MLLIEEPCKSDPSQSPKDLRLAYSRFKVIATCSGNNVLRRLPWWDRAHVRASRLARQARLSHNPVGGIDDSVISRLSPSTRTRHNHTCTLLPAHGRLNTALQHLHPPPLICIIPTPLAIAPARRNVDAPPPIRQPRATITTLPQPSIESTTHITHASTDTTMHIRATTGTEIRDRPARRAEEQEG
jgi:hypothetical protein